MGRADDVAIVVGLPTIYLKKEVSTLAHLKVTLYYHHTTIFT